MGRFTFTLTPRVDEVGDAAVAASVTVGLDLQEQGFASATVLFDALGVGLECQLKLIMKPTEFARCALSAITRRHQCNLCRFS